MRHAAPTFSKATKARLGMKLGLGVLPGPVAGSLLLLLGELSWGCNQQALRPPEAAIRHARHDARDKSEGERTTAPYPEHVAPPPAYGNKVVLARTELDSASF
jgi:hypothetical protein